MLLHSLKHFVVFCAFCCATRGVRTMLEKVADSARKAVKLAEPYKPYGGQFLEFCSISLSTYRTCMKLTRKSAEFCQFFCRHYPHMPMCGYSSSSVLCLFFLSGPMRTIIQGKKGKIRKEIVIIIISTK